MSNLKEKAYEEYVKHQSLSNLFLKKMLEGKAEQSEENIDLLAGLANEEYSKHQMELVEHCLEKMLENKTGSCSFTVVRLGKTAVEMLEKNGYEVWKTQYGDHTIKHKDVYHITSNIVKYTRVRPTDV